MSTSREHFQQLLRWLKLESEAEGKQLDERRRIGAKADAERFLLTLDLIPKQ